MNKGILVVVSGFSGAGKGTVMKRLLEKYDDYALSISVTTRNPRPGEEDGREYFFRKKGRIREADPGRCTDRICSVRRELLRYSAFLCGGTASGRQKCDPGD